MFLAFITQLHIFDSLLCIFVFFPVKLLYWRGLWDLWGVYIDPKPYKPAPQWILLAISTLSFASYFILPCMDWRLSKKRTLSYFSLTRLFMLINSALYLCYWRALWETVDYYLPSGLLACFFQFLITYGILLMLRSGRTCIFAPFYVALDTRDNLLRCDTRFNTTAYSWKYLLDSLLSHFVILALVICSWRALYNIIGHVFLPSSSPLPDVVCFFVGLFLTILLFLLEEILAHVTIIIEKEGFIYKLMFEDFCYLLIYIVTVILWRGAWRLTSRYVIPDPEMGGWICFAVGSICLTFLQVFSYLGRHDVVLDGGDIGRDAFYPTHYLRHYLLWDYDYGDGDSHKSGARTPPFPLDNSSFSYLSGSQCTVYDNIGHTNRLSVTNDGTVPTHI